MYTLIDAIMKNNIITTPAESEIENFIKRWFQLAGDRDGGRKARECHRRSL